MEMKDEEAVDIVSTLLPFENVYVCGFPLLSGVLDRIYRCEWEDKKTVKFAKEFLSCGCKESPYCGCPPKKLSKFIVELRMEGLDPIEIVKELEEYGIEAYQADIFDHLTQCVILLEAFERLVDREDVKEIRQAIEGY